MEDKEIIVVTKDAIIIIIIIITHIVDDLNQLDQRCLYFYVTFE